MANSSSFMQIMVWETIEHDIFCISLKAVKLTSVLHSFKEHFLLSKIIFVGLMQTSKSWIYVTVLKIRNAESYEDCIISTLRETKRLIYQTVWCKKKDCLNYRSGQKSQPKHGVGFLCHEYHVHWSDQRWCSTKDLLQGQGQSKYLVSRSMQITDSQSLKLTDLFKMNCLV